MDWNRQELNQVLTEYDATAADLLNSDHSSFESRLKRFVNLIESHMYLSYVSEVVLPNVNFSQWYEDACKTIKGMVGSGTLDWPIDRREHLSMQFLLLKYMAQGNEDPPNLCSKFMYAGNYLDDCVTKVNDQIIESFIRDFRQLSKSIAEQAILEASGKENIPYTTMPHWYQRPVGIVILGVIVTVVGGFAFLKLLS